jgi:hypothetical protein
VRQHLALDAFNESSLTTVSGSVVAMILPLHQGPLFFHVGLGAVGYRLRELNNGNTFVEHGMGWHTSAGAGADFHLARRVLLGPFIRFDYSELGSANVFFERLQHRVVALGVAFTLR